MEFTDYLKEISKQDNIMGDIAGDALRDKGFLKLKDYKEQKDRLNWKVTHGRMELQKLLSNFEKLEIVKK
jgi:hypothetical protein